MVGHADVGTVLQHLGRYTDFQVLGVEHTFISITRGLSMMQHGTAPLLAFDMSWTDSQQPAEGILDGKDFAANICNLCLHIQV